MAELGAISAASSRLRREGRSWYSGDNLDLLEDRRGRIDAAARLEGPGLLPGRRVEGMDLVPVYEDEAASGSIISVDPVTSQNMGVRLALATRRDLSRTVRTVGLVGYEERCAEEILDNAAGRPLFATAAGLEPDHFVGGLP